MRQVLCPVLVGRSDELDTLDEALAAARDGHGSTLVISGEAGIGKSRLAVEAEARASASGLQVLGGRAVHGGAQLPFRPLTEALRSVYRDRARPEAHELEPFGAALGRLVPEWADGTVVQSEASAVLSEAVLRLLRVLAGEDGVLLVLEDLHWADADTLAVVEYLADNLGDASVLVLCTERSDWPGPATEVLGGLVSRRSATRLALDPLSDDAVEEMARAAVGVGSVPAAVLGALRKRAEGVPFLVEEMLFAYVSAGGPAGAAPEWWISRRIADSLPPSYRDLIRARLGALDQDGRRVVATAAVVGRTFDWRLLGPVTGLDEERVLTALRSAASEQLVSGTEGSGATAFAFRHALARETLLADLLPPELTELSSRAADVIEDAYPGLPGEWCERAADLRVQAGERLGACRLLQESGRRALARGALATAEVALIRAGELATGDPMAWLGVDEMLVQVLSLAGKTERVVELAKRVLAGLDRYLSLSPDSMLRSRAAELHMHLARGALLSGELKLSRASIETARELSGARPSDTVSAPMDVLEAHLALAEGDPDTARGRAETAVDAAGRVAMPAVLCEGLEVAGQAAFRSGDLEGAVRAFERMEEESQRVGLVLQRMRALVELGTIDRLTRADAGRLMDGRALASATGAVSTLARVDLEIAWNHLELGEWESAAIALARSLETCRRFRLGLLSRALVGEGHLHALNGRREEMERAISEALEAAAGDPDVEAGVHGNARAVLHLVRGQREAANRELGTAVGILERSEVARPAWFQGLWALLETVEGGERERRSGLARPGALFNPPDRAYLAYADAVASGGRGRVDEALVAFAAGDASMPPGWRRHHARTLVGEAAAEDGWGEPGTWTSEALAFFDQAELSGLAAHARAVMRRAGVPVPRRGRGTAEVPAALRSLGVTSREVEVLGLVAPGLSNEEIGRRLFVSPRTVETHITSLLRKTGCGTRPQLVAFAGVHATGLPGSGIPDP